MRSMREKKMICAISSMAVLFFLTNNSLAKVYFKTKFFCLQSKNEWFYVFFSGCPRWREYQFSSDGKDSTECTGLFLELCCQSHMKPSPCSFAMVAPLHTMHTSCWVVKKMSLQWDWQLVNVLLGMCSISYWFIFGFFIINILLITIYL